MLLAKPPEDFVGRDRGQKEKNLGKNPVTWAMPSETQRQSGTTESGNESACWTSRPVVEEKRAGGCAQQLKPSQGTCCE